MLFSSEVHLYILLLKMRTGKRPGLAHHPSRSPPKLRRRAKLCHLPLHFFSFSSWNLNIPISVQLPQLLYNLKLTNLRTNQIFQNGQSRWDKISYLSYPAIPLVRCWRGRDSHEEGDARLTARSRMGNHLDGFPSLIQNPLSNHVYILLYSIHMSSSLLHTNTPSLQLQASEVTPRSPVPSHSNKNPRTPPQPSHGTSLAMMPMLSVACTFINSVTTPTAAHPQVLIVSQNGQHTQGQELGWWRMNSQPI